MRASWYSASGLEEIDKGRNGSSVCEPSSEQEEKTTEQTMQYQTTAKYFCQYFWMNIISISGLEHTSKKQYLAKIAHFLKIETNKTDFLKKCVFL